MGRRRAFDRAAALDAAMRVFWEHGYDGASLARLTAAMGITASSLYAAYGDKRALFTEALELYQATHGSFLARALAEERTARDAVGRMLNEAVGQFTTAARPRGSLVMLAAHGPGQDVLPVQEQLRAVRARTEQALRGRLARAAADGELPPGTAPRPLAMYYTAVLAGMSAQARDSADRHQLEGVTRLAMGAWPR